MPTTKRKIPMRQCLGCRTMFPKRELIRVVRSPEGEIAIDTRGKMAGRGAYICHSLACFQKARKAKAIERALGVAIPPEVYDTLEAQLEENA